MELEHIGLTIDITTKCNLKCKQCRTDSISHEFTLEEIKQIKGFENMPSEVLNQIWQKNIKCQVHTLLSLTMKILRRLV